jgi:hypothetical protein
LRAQPAPDSVTVRLRDVSRYTGQPFGFYVQVPGIASSPEVPRFQPSADFQIRLTGAAPATQDGYKRTVFTCEAIPQRSSGFPEACYAQGGGYSGFLGAQK